MRKTPVTAALIVREPQTKAHEAEMEGIALTAMTRQRNWSISIAGWFLNFLLTLHILMTCCRKSGCAGSYSPVNSHSSTRFTVSASISHSRLLRVSETVSMGRQREIHSSKNCVKALANSVSSESMQQHVAKHQPPSHTFADEPGAPCAPRDSGQPMRRQCPLLQQRTPVGNWTHQK